MLYSKSFKNETLDLNVLTFGTQKCSPGYHYGYAIRKNYLIHYIHSGRGTYTHNGTTNKLKAGQSFLILPGEPTFYAAGISDPWESSWVSLDGQAAPDLLEDAGYFRDKLCIDTGPAGFGDAFFRRMAEYSVHDSGNRGIAGLLLCYLFEASSLREKAQSNPGTSYVDKIKKFIASEYHHKISVSDIAVSMNLDRSYMSTMFKKKTGTSVQDYIVDFRIGKARTLLIHTDLSIKDIATSVGYRDQLNFSKIFKSRVGISPKNFRNQKS